MDSFFVFKRRRPFLDFCELLRRLIFISMQRQQSRLLTIYKNNFLDLNFQKLIFKLNINLPRHKWTASWTTLKGKKSL